MRAPKWIDAHRKLDAGIPITDAEEWKQIERSLALFYWVPAAVVIVLIIAFVALWGLPHSREQTTEFIQKCELNDGVITENFFYRKCERKLTNDI